MSGPGRTIQLFLVDGTPSGLRRVTLHGWTGVVLVAGDSAFGKLTARGEVDRTGVYLLVGADPDRPGGTRVYVGSGNSVSERIRQSAEKRDFWETAITVTTSDDDLSKGHAEYLEARLIEIAATAGRVVLDNGTRPDSARGRLPEADASNMEQFLLNLAVVLPVVGVEMLKAPPKAATRTAEPVDMRTEGEVRFVIQHRSGVAAEAVEEDGEFVVLEGSEAILSTERVQHPRHAALKASLRESGVLVPHSVGRLRFALPHAFRSPSSSAAVILDRSTNGRTRWGLKGTQTTYQEHQREAAMAPEPAP